MSITQEEDRGHLELIPVAEAARRFGVSRRTVEGWITRRRITGYKQELPQRTYVDAQEIERKRAIRPMREDGLSKGGES